MTVKDLLEILNNKYEIPSPEHAELCFYYEDENGKEKVLELKSIGAFDISTDITLTFIEDKKPVLITPLRAIKSQLRN